MRSIVLDRPSVLQSLEAIQVLQATPTYRVTCHVTQQYSAVPLMLLCTCAMHGFVMAGAARQKNKVIKATKMKYLGSWPIYVRRSGPADWLVSEQRPPSYKQDSSCMQSIIEDANPQ